MNGKRIMVFGLGRSGLAVARAALKEGAHPQVFDEKPLDGIAKADLVQECADLGVPVHLGISAADLSELYGEFDLLIPNPAVDKRHPALGAAQKEGIEIISEIEFAYRITRAPIIAITGTNGKSTTTVMTWQILKEAGVDAILCGNIYGTGYPEIPLTEAASASTTDQVLVAEISSFQLEWVRDFRPVCACITNISEDHLNRYDSFDDYAATKQRIFAAQTAQDVAVIRANDPVVVPPVGPMVKTFGSAGEHAFATGHRLVIGDEEMDTAELPFAGGHNYLNAMAAGLLAQSFLSLPRRRDPGGVGGQSLEFSPDPVPQTNATNEGIVKRGLQAFRSLAHRMEVIQHDSPDGITIINNSMCTNPQAVISSCAGINRPMHILMGGENKNMDFSPLRVLFDGTTNRGYAFGSVAEEIAGFGAGQITVHRTMQEAFDAATRQVLRGEVIILAPGCASTDQFKDFRHRGDVFKALAKEWLEACSKH